MLQIKHICKAYKTGHLVQKALDDVSLNLRENEFVAILGPSGSGKTTLLNIIGGLDRYDSGDLVIDGISTKKYKDRDWDSYRNHTIGFVFQSYNLIPHQSVLSNVELALTISGISKKERRKRAVRALEQVGLGDQLHKKPGQMSGGQMQRVAIARALVNDPKILLADEPTGALDSDTGVQVMELLKEVAKDRLVVMVTHNPELAEAYATRIVRLRDGKLRADSDPYEPEDAAQAAPVHKNMGKASMSLWTALSLSFNNLRTKKARTILTAFAGSIGIIGIALILSLSNGMNNYIQSVEENTLSEYPVQIQGSGVDVSAMMGGDGSQRIDGSEGEVGVTQMITNLLSKVDANDLRSLKTYLDSGESGVEQYTKAIEYTFNVSPQLYRIEGSGVRQVHPDRSFEALGLGSSSDTNSLMSMFMSTDVFYEMPESTSLYENQYEVKAGRWPEAYNECVIVLTNGGNISDFMLYTLGLRDSVELDKMVERFLAEEPVETPVDLRPYKYDELVGITFRLVNASDYYEYDTTYGVWKDCSGDEAYLRSLVENGEEITVVGVVQPAENADAAMLQAGIGYPSSLTAYVMEQAEAAPIVQEQLANSEINVLTGTSFGEERGEFDMTTLFSVDEDALAEAFQLDENALQFDPSAYLNLDFGTIDLSSMLDFSKLDLPEADLAALLEQLDLTVSPEALSSLGASLLQNYAQYAAQDYARLQGSFSAYLQTPQAKQLLAEHLEQIMLTNGNLTVSAEHLESLMRSLLEGFAAYAAENGVTDPAEFNDCLTQYLQTAEAQTLLQEGAVEILQFSGQLILLPEQLNALAEDLIAGYQTYAAENELPDPTKAGEHFMTYLQTPEAQTLLSEGVAALVDADELQAALSTALQGYTETIAQAVQTQLSSALNQAAAQLGQRMAGAMQQAVAQAGAGLSDALQIDAETFVNAIQVNMTEEELAELFLSMLSGDETSFDRNLKRFGYADPGKPAQINLYPKDFESKTAVLNILDEYNRRMEAEGMEEKVIRYSDVVGTLMSSVTEIVDVISYVLVAFVAISLVVSSIMIGVITYISVVERRKEIGILRAIGASKRNISEVFNAETFIIGLSAGVIGIAMTLLLLLPANALIHSLAGRADINAALPLGGAVILVVLSVVLTLISGLLPSRKAAKSDPVTALRAE
ncbi:MAG: ATP-binding cassette domain-containing protein [Faecousia sp.]